MKNLKATKVGKPAEEMSEPIDNPAEDKMEPKHPEHEVTHSMETVMKAEEIKQHPTLWPLVQKKMKDHMGTMKKFTSLDQLREEAKKKA